MILNETEVIQKIFSTKIDEDIYSLTFDKKGRPNVSINIKGKKRFIHSRYDAVQGGEAFALGVYSSSSHLAVFGMGLGYHIKSLLKMLSPGQKLYVFETNLALLRLASETVGFDDYRENENVHLYAGNDMNTVLKYYVDFLCGGIKIILYAPVLDTVPDLVRLMSRYNEIYLIKLGKNINSISLDDVRAKVRYNPIKRKNSYRVLMLGQSRADDSLETFIKNMGIALEYLGCFVQYMESKRIYEMIENKQQINLFYGYLDSFDFLVTVHFGCIYPSFFNIIQKPIICIGVDRPYSSPNVMDNNANYVIYTWSDKYDLHYADMYFKNSTHHFLAHCAELNYPNESVFNADRPLGVVLSCSYNSFSTESKSDFFNHLLNYYAEAGKKKILEDCVLDFLGKKRDDEDLYKIMHEDGMLLDSIIRQRKRYRMVQALLDGGVTIHLFGNGWENTGLTKHPNCIYFGGTGFESGRLIFEQSKILINSMPSYTMNSAHDRIFSSMASGVLCITDANDYLREIFKENDEIVFYDNDNLHELVEKVKYFLNNEEERLRITKNAYKIVTEQHTWINRVEEVIDMYEDFLEKKCN